MGTEADAKMDKATAEFLAVFEANRDMDMDDLHHSICAAMLIDIDAMDSLSHYLFAATKFYTFSIGVAVTMLKDEDKLEEFLNHVDDTTYRMLCLRLNQLGYTVDTMGDGEELLNADESVAH